MFKDLFQKKRKYATIPSERLERSGGPAEGERPKREIPEGLMSKCSKCGTIQYSKELEKNLKVCPACGHHMRLNALERIAVTLDPEGFIEFDSEMTSVDPLQFPGYASKLEQQRSKTGQVEAVITGQGTLGGHPVIVAVMNFEFFSGSMGSVVGEKITRAVEEATEKKLPLLIFSTSGGARMQESILSLMQMAKTSAALARFGESGGLYISVITDPTTGGYPRALRALVILSLLSPEPYSASPAELLLSRPSARSCRMISRRLNLTFSMASLIW